MLGHQRSHLCESFGLGILLGLPNLALERLLLLNQL